MEYKGIEEPLMNIANICRNLCNLELQDDDEIELESFKCLECSIGFTIPKEQEACPRCLGNTIEKINGELAFSHSKPVEGIHVDYNNPSVSTPSRIADQRRLQAQKTFKDRRSLLAQRRKKNAQRRRQEDQRKRQEAQRKKQEAKIRAQRRRIQRRREIAQRRSQIAQRRRLEEIKRQTEEAETIQRFPHTEATMPISKIPLKELNEISITPDHYYTEGGRMNPPTCTICYENMLTKAIKLPCSHLFHSDCLSLLLSRHTTCPLCREPIQ
ncbi:unnamed protein product [Moneuplotes crassus]|uniref:RING-type domain-containing protein n=1 Tax=Euplotes crassus TaxID=5936 RepID=A0AAD1XRS7_EUPCR|nr:unnamed protein product [Moneuplotes crassus]